MRSDPAPLDGRALHRLVSAELNSLALQKVRDSSRTHTVAPSVLVEEAWHRLSGPRDRSGGWTEAEFMRQACRALQRITILYARRRQKLRAAGLWRVESLRVALPGSATTLDVFDLGLAVDRLGREAPGDVRLVELVLHAGRSMRDVAMELGLSERMAERRWAQVRARRYHIVMTGGT